MSFFSRSRSKGHYPNPNYGGGYYKRPYRSGGIIGKIFDKLLGSQNHSGSYSNHNNGYYPNRHHRKGSWS